MENARQTPKTKAFGYLRVSGKGQVTGDGFPRQQENIEKWVAANNVEIVQWFIEKGVTGTIADRPAFNDMLLALMADGVRTVVIEKLDRLARDIIVQETIVQDLQRRGFTLVSAMEPDMCSDDPTRTLMRQMMGVFAEYDRAMIVLKTRAARERIRKSGVRCEGRKPYGTRDGEQDVVSRIRSLHNDGMNYEQIAKQFNAESVTSRSGGKWYPASVRRIVLGKS